MSVIENILAHLNRVRERPDGSFQASCPTSAHVHGDRSAGLKLTVADDGKILLWCPAGCRPDDITSAIGLPMTCLFPPRDPEAPVQKRPSKKMLEAARLEAMLVLVAIENFSNGSFQITAADADRLAVAGTRLRKFSEGVKQWI